MHGSIAHIERVTEDEVGALSGHKRSGKPVVPQQFVLALERTIGRILLRGTPGPTRGGFQISMVSPEFRLEGLGRDQRTRSGSRSHDRGHERDSVVQ